MIVSLESSARLDFFTDGDERVASVLLRPRSVVAFADAAYLSLKHGIAAARADTLIAGAALDKVGALGQI